MLVVHCPALRPPENGYFIQNTCNNHFNAACGVRCNPGFDLVGSSILLCLPNGLWSGSESSCRGMQTASSHCLLIALLDFLDLTFNGPVKFFVSFDFIDHRPQKEKKIIGTLEVRTTKFNWPHHRKLCPLCFFYEQTESKERAFLGRKWTGYPKPQISSSQNRVPRRGLEWGLWGLMWLEDSGSHMRVRQWEQWANLYVSSLCLE